jgi:ClpX C4-type zinc finger
VEGTEQPPHHDYVYSLRNEEAYLQSDDEKPPITREAPDFASVVCQFCGKSWNEVQGVFQAKRRVRDPNTSALAVVWICNECVAQMAQTLAEEPAGTPWLLGWGVWSQRGAVPP